MLEGDILHTTQLHNTYILLLQGRSVGCYYNGDMQASITLTCFSISSRLKLEEVSDITICNTHAQGYTSDVLHIFRLPILVSIQPSCQPAVITTQGIAPEDTIATTRVYICTTTTTTRVYIYTTTPYTMLSYTTTPYTITYLMKKHLI